MCDVYDNYEKMVDVTIFKQIELRESKTGLLKDNSE